MIISVCPAGWDSVESQRGLICYNISSSTEANKNWTDARDVCKREGGDLANFKNKEEAVSFCAKMRTERRNSVIALAYLWHTICLS